MIVARSVTEDCNYGPVVEVKIEEQAEVIEKVGEGITVDKLLILWHGGPC